MRSGQCPKCGSGEIAGPHGTLTGEGRLRIDLPGIRTATVLSLTCENCGYTEFYADRGGLENLRRDGRQFQSQTQRSHERCPRCGTRVTPMSSLCSECGHVF
ncbi:MAG: hypothetical protein GF411_06000 [Candidatus Lokiarchaeota archaeon]|nr:hypothetical protein [Candidatus Lokiarchaeota archaeon]